MALTVSVCYLAVFLTGKLLWFDMSGGLAGWITSIVPSKGAGYTLGWILGNNLFWYAMAISAVTALFGAYRFSFVTFGGCIIGILAGIICGFYPNDDPCNSHYGWLAWILSFFLSITAGILTEIFVRKWRKKHEQTNNCSDQRRSF